MIAMAFIASAVLFVSCAEIEEHQEEIVGYLAVPTLEVDFSVDRTLLTKAFDFEVLEPEMSDIYFVVRDKDNSVRYEGKGLWTESLVLPVGSYYVEASYGSNGFDGPYFVGSAQGTIENQDLEVPSLAMSLKNALVSVRVDKDFGVHFSTGKEVSLKCGEVTKGIKQEEWTYIPAGDDVSIELSLAGTNSFADPVTFTYTLAKPSSKYAYEILCKPDGQTNWPSIGAPIIEDNNVWACMAFITELPQTQNIPEDRKDEIVIEAIPTSGGNTLTAVKDGNNYVFNNLTPGVPYNVRARIGNLTSEATPMTPTVDGLTVSAEHTKNSAGELDGTDVTTSLSKSDLIKDAITTWDIDICRSDGTQLLSDLSLGTSDGSAITDVVGWPYLPTGNGESYVIKASADMDGQTYDFNDISVTGLSAPDFSLTLSAYTSYDKYAGTNSIISNVDEANSCDAATLYKAGAKWSISTDIMKNSNYSKTIAIYIDGNATGRTSTVTSWNDNFFYQDIAGLSWASHTHKVAFTFDNKTVTSAEHTHHITGLPYSYNFIDGSLDSYKGAGWSLNGELRVSSEGLIGHPKSLVLQHYVTGTDEEGFIVSRRFNVPSSITVQPRIERSIYCSSGSRKRTGYVGAVSNTTSSNTSSVTFVTEGSSYGGDTWGGNAQNDWLTSFELSNSAPYISVDCDGRGSWAGGIYYFLYAVHFRYAQ